MKRAPSPVSLAALRRTALLGLSAACLLACKDEPVDSASPPAVTYGEGLFSEGCPPEGESIARVIGVDDTLPGEIAVGTRGDLLIANEHAAYVITEPDKGSTYYYYGGVVADAAAMDGCAPATDDKLNEVGLVLGKLDLTNFNQSILRGFRGTHAEVLNDGSDGSAAIVRITGTDDTHWLVEYELIAAALDEGGRPFSDPFGLELVVDYILQPDSPVLEIQITARNPTDEDQTVFWAALLSFGVTLDLYAYASDELSIGGFTLDYGIPWMVATDGEGGWAYAVDAGSLAWTRISGIDVAIDISHVLVDPGELAANGGEHQRSVYLTVGPTDGASATSTFAPIAPETLMDQPYTQEALSGRVLDPDGAGVAGARVVVEADSGDGAWGEMDEARTDESGAFSLAVPIFEEGWSWRLVARGDGRDDGATVDVSPGDSEIELDIGALGGLEFAITDAEGEASPARVVLERSDGARFDLWLADSGATALPPGDYAWTATRGYEYTPDYGEVTIPAGGSGAITPELERIVDTAGFLSVDTHVHTSYSPDGTIHAEDQLLHAAAHGLEVMMHTEHEHIVDATALPASTGLGRWVVNTVGEEVTATLPEHMTMYPAEADGSPRGGIVEWYGLDIDQLFTEMYARSAGGINIFNHPGYMNDIGWDRVTAEPTLDDPTLLGLPSNAAIWSWQFDGIEVMNGHGSPFSNGRFDNWQSLLNAGYPILAVGCSDDHGGDQVGFPRTWFAAPSDEPEDYTSQWLIDAFAAGETIASAGAFARVQVGEVGLGGLVADADGAVALDLHIEAIPEIDVTHAVVFANCDQVLTVAADDPDGVIKLSETLTIPVDIGGDTHLTVAAFGQNALPTGLPQYDGTQMPRVLTNPIYIDGDGDGAFSAPGGRECTYDLAAP